MKISKNNADNSMLFQHELEKYPEYITIIIAKNFKYLPKLKHSGKTYIFLKEDNSCDEIIQNLEDFTVYFKDTLPTTIETKSYQDKFSEKIFRNMHQNSEIALQDAAKYAAILFMNHSFDSNEFVIISGSGDYPDAMILLNASIPNSQEKTQIKKILCYPHLI